MGQFAAEDGPGSRFPEGAVNLHGPVLALLADKSLGSQLLGIARLNQVQDTRRVNTHY